MEALSFSILDIILLSAAGLFLFIQLFYYLGVYYRIHAHNRAVKKGNIDFTDDLPPVSIVIRACDESANLRHNLEFILQQDYPQFEVIVINDGFTDESEEFLIELESKYSNLYHSFTPEQIRNISGKKLALTLGIKASKYDWLVFTEANCRPVSNQWLRLIARNFTPTTDIVLGYSGYTYYKGWHNKLISFDSIFLSMRYLGMALNSNTYMGIGRNLAYRKRLFFDNKGFSHYLDLRRGEDDLFINEVANDMNTRVEASGDSVIRVDSLDYTKLDWKEDKISYLVTSKYFKGSQRSVIGFETLSRMLFYVLCITGTTISILQYHWLAAGIAFLIWLIRLIVQSIVINSTSKDLNEKRRYFFSLPIFDFLLPLQSFFFRLSHLARKDNYTVNR
jgi:glycosyltransferase involved in cell wall biosynthesis